MSFTDRCFLVRSSYMSLHPFLASSKLVLTFAMSSYITREFRSKCPMEVDFFPFSVSCTAQPMFIEDARAAPNEPCPTLFLMSSVLDSPTEVLTAIFVSSFSLNHIL